MASNELFTPAIGRHDPEGARERLERVKNESRWDEHSTLANLLVPDALPDEHAMEGIDCLAVTEQQLQGFLFQKYPAIAVRYEVQEAINFAKQSKAGKKERRDTSVTFEAHLNVATILATHFYERAKTTDQYIGPALVITALLHDCIEDGDMYTASEIAQHFGYPLASNVVLLSKKGNYLYVGDSYKAIKKVIRQGIGAMRNISCSSLQPTTADSQPQDTWPEIRAEIYMARLKESDDLGLQVIKMADRAANLLTDWHSVVHHLPTNEPERAKYTQKIVEYIEETRNLTLQPFMYDTRLSYAVRYNLNACYHIERKLLSERAKGTFEEYVDVWCQEQEQKRQSETRQKDNPNRPF